MTKQESKQYHLNSTSLIHVPGIARFARNIRATDYEPEYADRLVRVAFFAEAFPTAPVAVAVALAEGLYRVDGDTIIVELPS